MRALVGLTSYYRHASGNILNITASPELLGRPHVMIPRPREVGEKVDHRVGKFTHSHITGQLDLSPAPRLGLPITTSWIDTVTQAQVTQGCQKWILPVGAGWRL